MSTTSPINLIEKAKGKPLGQIAKMGVGGWMLAVAVSAIRGFQTGVDLLFLTPAEILMDLMGFSVDALIKSPLGIVPAGAQTSTEAVRDFGLLGVVVAVALVLATLYIVQWYRSEEETSDTFPGIGIDVIPWVGDEEATEDQ